MKVEFQNKTYWLRNYDYVTLTQLRGMVASDMYNPMCQDKPISYHKVKNYDVEHFMDKYFVRCFHALRCARSMWSGRRWE